jgi:hypothetical protein
VSAGSKASAVPSAAKKHARAAKCGIGEGGAFAVPGLNKEELRRSLTSQPSETVQQEDFDGCAAALLGRWARIVARPRGVTPDSTSHTTSPDPHRGERQNLLGQRWSLLAMPAAVALMAAGRPTGRFGN